MLNGDSMEKLCETVVKYTAKNPHIPYCDMCDNSFVLLVNSPHMRLGMGVTELIYSILLNV